MVQIIPAILSTSEEDYARDISRYQQSPSFQAGWVHIDFMDNKFVPNKSIDPSVIVKYPIDLHKEVHLMVTHPFQIVSQLVEQKIDRIIIHVESETTKKPERWLDNLHSNLDYIGDHGLHVTEKGIESGLAIKLETPLEELFPYLNDIDVLLIMSIEPGFQGQQFNPATLSRIKKMVEIRENKGLDFKIGVDGGVKDSNIREIVDVGADYVVVGSYLLKGDIDENLENLWEMING